jgi:hypothetical protein
MIDEDKPMGYVHQAVGEGSIDAARKAAAEGDVTANLNPIGRVFYAASTLICTPASQSQEVGAALGAQAGESRLRDVATAAGFSRFR